MEMQSSVPLETGAFFSFLSTAQLPIREVQVARSRKNCCKIFVAGYRVTGFPASKNKGPSYSCACTWCTFVFYIWPSSDLRKTGRSAFHWPSTPPSD